jgi:pimeloyl-ACP methyl ester carboxylesterase
MANEPTVVLVHGAWHGGWCWDMVVRQLDAAGVASVTVENPSVAQAPADLHADGDNVRRVLDGVDGPVVLVGHSYGGAVITDAGAHPAVAQLVYLTAFALDDGESVIQNDLAGLEDVKLGEGMRFETDTAQLDLARAVEFFFHDCTPDVAASAVAQLRPMSMAAMTCTPRAVAWREKPSTYIVCTDDRALPVTLQQSNANRLGTVFEMPTSHSPFLSRPDDLARLLIEISSR